MARHDRIVVGVDGSDCSVEALRWAAEEARLRGAQVEVLYVWHLPYGGAQVAALPYPDEEFEAIGAQVLEYTINEAGELDVAVERRVEHGHAANELIEASQRADLVVIGSRGHGGVAGTLLGSVSQRVATHAACPVVVVRRTDG